MSGFALVFDFQKQIEENDDDFSRFENLVADYKDLPLPSHQVFSDQCAATKFDTPSSLHKGIVKDTETGSWLFAVGTLVIDDQENPSDGNLAFLLERYLEEGNTVFSNLDGTFTLVIYNKQARKLLVVTDPLGFNSVFYAREKNKLYIASSSLALANIIQALPDKYGIYLFLTTGGVYGKTTLWQNVERIPAATVFETASSEISETTYWQPSLKEEVTRLSLAQTVDSTIDLLSANNKRFLQREGTVWADLTGGFDSRLTSTILDHCGLPFEASCQGPKTSPDVRLSSQIAQELGWGYKHNILPDTWGKERCNRFEQALGKGDAHLDVFKLSSVLWDQDQRKQDHHVSVWGLGGELWRGFFWRQEFFNVGRNSEVNYDRLIDYRMMHPIDSKVFADTKAISGTREELKFLLRSIGEQCADSNNTFKLDCIYAYKNTAHTGAHLSSVIGQQRAINPLFFKASMEYAISINFKWRNADRLVRLLLEKVNPTLAKIHTTSGGPALPMRITNLHKFKPYWTSIGKQLIRKSSRTLLGRSILPELRDEFSTYPIARWRRDTLTGIMKDKLLSHSYMHSGDLYDPQGLADFVNRANTDQFGQETFLSRMVTVEMALRSVGTSI